jgi:hypothetical protein
MRNRLSAFDDVDCRGKYDEDYIDYVIGVLSKCKQHGILAFMDPHQDTVFAHVIALMVSGLASQEDLERLSGR